MAGSCRPDSGLVHVVTLNPARMAIVLVFLAAAATILAMMLGWGEGLPAAMLTAGSVAMLSAVALSIRRPGWMMAAAVMAAVLLPGLLWWFSLPQLLQYVPDGLVSIFAIVTLSGVLLRRVTPRMATSVLLLLIPLAVVLAVQEIHSPVAVQAALALMIGPAMLFGAANASERALRAPLVACGGILLFQTVVVLAQRFGGFYTVADRVGGTFGRAGTSSLAVVAAGLWVAVVTIAIVRRSKKAAVLSFLPLVAMALGEAKAGFFMAAAGIAVVGAAMMLRRGTWRAGIAAMLLALLPVVGAYVGYRYFSSFLFGDATAGSWFIDWTTNPSRVSGYLLGSQEGQAGRVAALELAWRDIADQGRLLVGNGLGSLSTSGALGEGLATRFTLTTQLGWAPSAARMVFETGLLGLGGFIGLVCSASVIALQLRRAESATLRALGLAAPGLATVFLFGGFYTSAWHTRAVAIPFWLVMGIACGLALRRRRSKTGVGATSPHMQASAGTGTTVPRRWGYGAGDSPRSAGQRPPGDTPRNW